MAPPSTGSPTTATLTPAHHSEPPPGAGNHAHLAAKALPFITEPPKDEYGRVLPVEMGPHQLRLARVICATHGAGSRRPIWHSVAVQVSRRSGKTSVIESAALARCLAWPDYRVVYMAQSHAKSRERFADAYKWMRNSRQLGANEGKDWRARESRGEERFEFRNGALWRFPGPFGDALRSDAADLIIIDEAQEHDPATTVELLAAAQPSMDTRPISQLIVAGTAALDRDRMLWSQLERARKGEPGWGIVEYAAAADADPSDVAVWQQVHLGLADGLTTLDKIAASKATLDDAGQAFPAEYLGIWPDVAASTAFSPEVWAAAGAEHAPFPTRVAIAFDVSPLGERASVAAAWRPAEGGPARIELIESRPGTGWVVPMVVDLARRHRCPIGYDAAGRGTLDLADQIAQQRPRVKTAGLDLASYVTGCSAFARAVLDGDLLHPRQPHLTEAVEVAARRPIGDAGWGWARRKSAGDITPLVAATVALRTFDTMPPPARPRIRAA